MHWAKKSFQTRDGLLMSKTTSQKPEISKASQDIRVSKYEPVATRYYEHLYGVTIDADLDSYLIPSYRYLGLLLTGFVILDLPMDMRDVCWKSSPPKRNFTHEVPRHCWMQMQGQLEVCDLDECDFFQVKLEEYEDVTEYEADCLVTEASARIHKRRISQRIGDSL